MTTQGMELFRHPGDQAPFEGSGKRSSELLLDPMPHDLEQEVNEDTGKIRGRTCSTIIDH